MCVDCPSAIACRGITEETMQLALLSGEPGRSVLIAAGIIIILAGMKAASAFIAPLLLSVFLAILFSILLRWFERKGLSHRSALFLVIFIFLAVIAGFILLIVGLFFQVSGQLPEYLVRIDEQIPSIQVPVLSGWVDLPTGTVTGYLAGIAGPVLSEVSSVLGSMVFIVLATLFLIAESGAFTRKIHEILQDRPHILARVSLFGERIVRYLVVKTEVNLATGVGAGLVVAAVGVEYAVFWGFLAFIMAYIPYIGFWLAIIPPMILAYIGFGPGAALIVLAGAGIIDVLVEDVVFPQVAGRQLSLSPFIVLASLFFWGFILGPFGLLLAVPLTMTIQMVCGFWEGSRWLGMLIGPPDPPPR